MHPYASPVLDGAFVHLKRVDFDQLIASVGQVAPPEMHKELVQTLFNPAGEWVESSPDHPENEQRQQQYRDQVWSIISRNYLVNGVDVELTDEEREAVAKVRDTLGELIEVKSDHMVYLTQVFTDPRQPQQLSNLIAAIQGINWLNGEAASNMARLFRYPEAWSQHLRLADAAG